MKADTGLREGLKNRGKKSDGRQKSKSLRGAGGGVGEHFIWKE